MGYKRTRKVYNLVFDDEDMQGLEVKARSMPLGELMEMANVIDNMNAASLEEVNEMLSTFADVLISWNLEDEDGVTVPPTVEGLYAQDTEFVFSIIGSFVNAVSGVPAPLEQPSPGGEPSLAASIPMDVPSASLAS